MTFEEFQALFAWCAGLAEGGTAAPKTATAATAAGEQGLLLLDSCFLFLWAKEGRDGSPPSHRTYRPPSPFSFHHPPHHH